MDTIEFARLRELVAASRTYRRFDEARPVPRELLEALVDVARLAPTGNNTQTLRFHLSTEPGEVAAVLSHHRWAGLLADWDGPEEGARPTAYVSVLGPAGARKNAIRNQDAGIAAQTLALAARAAGLGCCMVASFDAHLMEAIGLEARANELEPLVILALGWPAADETVVLEPADTEHGLAYWRERDALTGAWTHHVPKLALEELLV